MKKNLDILLERIALQQNKIVTVLIVMAIAYPYIITNQYLMRLSILALMYVMLSLGLNLVTGYMGQMSFGNAAFWGIGAYVAAIMTKNMSLGSGIAFLGAMLLTGIFGFLLGLPVLKLKGYYLTIVTMGFCEIMRLVELNWMEVTNGPLGISAIPKFNIFGIKLLSYKSYYYIILILVIATTVIVRRIVNSRVGLAIKSIRDDDVAAESMGVNIVKYKILTFTISSMIAGVAGAFYAQYISYIDPSSFTYNASQEMLVIIIFGGLGSIPGCFLGAIILTVLPELLRGLAEYRMLIYGALMVIMMIVKPSGVLGSINFDHLRLIATAKKEEMGGTENGR
jgi:branched-chain amino acid transport system permease protein